MFPPWITWELAVDIMLFYPNYFSRYFLKTRPFSSITIFPWSNSGNLTQYLHLPHSPIKLGQWFWHCPFPQFFAPIPGPVQNEALCLVVLSSGGSSALSFTRLTFWRVSRPFVGLPDVSSWLDSGCVLQAGIVRDLVSRLQHLRGHTMLCHLAKGQASFSVTTACSSTAWS